MPPICSFSVPAPVCWKLPDTFSVPAADALTPSVSEPLLVKLPAVVKLAPASIANEPVFVARFAIPWICAPRPESTRLAWLVMIFVPPGNSSIEPFNASHVPPVSVVPEIWVVVLASTNTMPGSASIVPVFDRLPLTNNVDVPVPAVLSIVPSLMTAVCPPPELSMPESDPMQVRAPGLDLQRRGGDVVAREVEIAGAGLNDRADVVQRAVAGELLFIRARQVERARVRDVAGGGIDCAAGPLKQVPTKLSVRPPAPTLSVPLLS